jgi:hypothetical protein
MEAGLFDCNSEPPDQPCDFVQIGIVTLDRLRQPNQAFVVAHRRYVARYDRRHRMDEIGLGV